MFTVAFVMLVIFGMTAFERVMNTIVAAEPYYRAARAVVNAIVLCGFVYKWTGRGPVAVVRDRYGVDAANRVSYNLICLAFGLVALDIASSLLRLIGNFVTM